MSRGEPVHDVGLPVRDPLQGVPLDALVVHLGSNRDAIYKTLFDARRKLRTALVANEYLSTTGNRADVVPIDGAEGRRS